jgi:hypothetical protein
LRRAPGLPVSPRTAAAPGQACPQLGSTCPGSSSSSKQR